MKTLRGRRDPSSQKRPTQIEVRWDKDFAVGETDIDEVGLEREQWPRYLDLIDGEVDRVRRYELQRVDRVAGKSHMGRYTHGNGQVVKVWVT